MSAGGAPSAASGAPGPDETVEPLLLREVMGGFATGVAVITTEEDGQPHGMTANSLTSVSLDPPLILICLMSDSRTSIAVQHAGAFVVNLLERRQEPVSNRFARRGEDHFEGTAFHRGRLGLPVLSGGLGHVECRVEAVHPGGDHDIIVGRVVAATTRSSQPLLFFRGRYDSVAGQASEPEFLWYG